MTILTALLSTGPTSLVSDTMTALFMRLSQSRTLVLFCATHPALSALIKCNLCPARKMLFCFHVSTLSIRIVSNRGMKGRLLDERIQLVRHAEMFIAFTLIRMTKRITLAFRAGKSI